MAAFAVLGLAALAAVVFAARWALNYRAPCSQPCRDLGIYPPKPYSIDYSDPAQPWLKPASIQARMKVPEPPCPAPKCAPLKLDLELFKPEAKVNRRYTLWYRVSMKNVSCVKLGFLGGDFFMGPGDRNRNYHAASGFKIKVRDPHGNEVPDSGAPRPFSTAPEDNTEYGDVIPYDHDPAVGLKLAKDIPMDSDWDFYLNPGQSIATLSSRLHPTRMELVGMIDEYGRPGSGPLYVDVDLKGAPKPPPGFRILEQFIFKKPGKHTIQVTMENARLPATPSFPYEGPVPAPLCRFMRFAGFIGEYDCSPASRDTRKYHVRAESQTLEFEVKH